MTTTVKGLRAADFEDPKLDEETWKKLREQINETEENRKRGLEKLRKKLLEKEDLNPCLDENFLLGFLRLSKFDVSKAYQRILAFYTEMRNSADIFSNNLPSSIKIVENARQIFASPYRMPNHSALLILKRLDYDPMKIPYDVILRGAVLMGIMFHLMPLTQLCGNTLLLDLKTSSWGSFSEYTPTRLKLIARLFQKVIPFRMSAVHVINAPSIYYVLYSIIYPFLSTKMKNRIFLHKNLESLQSCIDPEILPKEYGGCLEPSELINGFNMLYEYEDYFRKQAAYGYVKKKK